MIPLKRSGQSSGRALIGDIAGPVPPEGAVARVEPDPPDLRARAAQHLAQLMKKRPMRPLQKQKTRFSPVTPVMVLHLLPLTTGYPA